MKNPVQDIMQIVCLRGRSVVVSLSSSTTLDIDLKSIMEFARWRKKKKNVGKRMCIIFIKILLCVWDLDVKTESWQFYVDLKTFGK